MCCVFVSFNINEQGKATELKKKYKEKKYYKLPRNYIPLCLNWSRDFELLGHQWPQNGHRIGEVTLEPESMS